MLQQNCFLLPVLLKKHTGVRSGSSLDFHLEMLIIESKRLSWLLDSPSLVSHCAEEQSEKESHPISLGCCAGKSLL